MMNILIVGTGYVGLVTAACFAEMGHHVTCLDIDENKIEMIQQGKIPFFEPSLKELVEINVSAGRLFFTTNYSKAVQSATICFLAVPTPSLADGSCDLQYLISATSEIARHLNGYKIIVNKSTAPVGTVAKLHNIIASIVQEKNRKIPFDVVSNPEFLKEGNAVLDCMKPDRIILGTENGEAIKLLKELYSPFVVNHDRIFVMDPSSAELTKYAANAMLALRISFMNELSRLCEKVGANINQIRLGIGSDQRIGFHFLYAGAGYGGSCFPKDIKALFSTAKEHGVTFSLLDAVQKINQQQQQLFFNKISSYFEHKGGLREKTIAIWGLSFKPNTDDLREAPALTLIEKLIACGANVRLFDPVALSKLRTLYKDSPQAQLCQDEYDAASNAHAIVLMTEWKQFRSVDFHQILPTLQGHAFFDGRNQYSPTEMSQLGFDYFGIGIPQETLSSPLDDPIHSLTHSVI